MAASAVAACKASGRAHQTLVEHGEGERRLRWPPFVERRLADACALGHGLHREVADRFLLKQRINGVHDGVVRVCNFAAWAADPSEPA